MNAPEKLKQYNRDAQVVGNIVHLEHFNVIVGDQRFATLFYVVGLGGTRDPYIFSGLENMWVNFGRTQVHLPNRGGKAPEVLRGTAGFVVPSLEEAKKRLEHAGNEMKRIAPDVKTRFSWREKEGTIEATCPWGNRVRLHAPSPEFGRTELALAYVDFDVPQGTAEGIARFYNEIMRAPARFDKNRTSVSIGRDQRLFFTETAAPQPEYDNHHIQIYIADFASPYHWLKERGLINMETDAEEWRFQWITDPRDGRKLFQIEHEVRSMKHRLFARPLVNRNHGVTNLNFVPGADAFRGTY
ncbi:MAG TPA: glyoxalase/bleomycin resistance/dioxygenase family protein [Burkholderiales bacterium]